MADDPDVSSFGASFQNFMERMSEAAPVEESQVLVAIRDHFGGDPSRNPVVAEKFELHDHANVHTAVERLLAVDGRSHALHGVVAPFDSMQQSLSQMVMGSTLYGGKGPSVGPVAYSNVSLGDGELVASVRNGLFLVSEGAARWAMYVTVSGSWNEHIQVEVMAVAREQAEAVLAELRASIRARNVYRGKVISVEGKSVGSVDVRFHHLPQVKRDDIILPDGILERVELHTIGFARHREQLQAAGCHLKRGLLLHGPPGTGKTLTAMYLAGRMPDRTVILLTGRDHALVRASCALARMLEPATLIMEDVDLIAEERTRGGTTQCSTLLYELLNEMDGLAEDADILFLLTTNRPEILEPALASRPGRVDLAVEVPLPDTRARRRLIALYSRGLTLQVKDLDRILVRTEGASAAFIRELLRKAALFAVDSGGDLVVRDQHLDEAIHDLVSASELTSTLLGAKLRDPSKAN